MAGTWRDVASSPNFNYNGSGNNSNVRIKVQWLDGDPDYDWITRGRIRFLVTDYTANADGYYLLWSPNTGNETTTGIHYPKETTWYTPEFTLIKKAYDYTFTIPEIWLVNTGSAWVSYNKAEYGKNSTLTYGDGGTQTIYNYFKSGGLRQNYKTVRSSTTIEGYTNCSAGGISIVDNEDNTFTINYSRGAAGYKNPIRAMQCWWTQFYVDGEWYRPNDTNSHYSTTDTTYSKTVTLSGLTKDSQRTVGGYITTTPTHGKSQSAECFVKVNQYRNPEAPGKPVLKKTKSKLTVREPWSFEWPAAKAVNNISAIQGYRIRVYRKAKDNTRFGQIGIKLNEDNKLTWKAGEVYLDTENTKNYVTFDPKELGFEPGDTVMLGIYAYTKNKNGKGTKLFNGNGTSDQEVFSDEYLVENAGVMKVKVNNTWKEGQVWVKVNDTWKEATAMQTKVDGQWKESV